ncbi:MAG: hypothetical protein Q4A05_05020 [Ruminococcus sp.]|nr:hypothetical protein [Ruminococcus sp.]
MNANVDREVIIADAIFIFLFIANKDKYELKIQGKGNAACYNTRDRVTEKEALGIQRFVSGMTRKLSEA